MTLVVTLCTLVVVVLTTLVVLCSLRTWQRWMAWLVATSVMFVVIQVVPVSFDAWIVLFLAFVVCVAGLALTLYRAWRALSRDDKSEVRR